MVRKIVTLYFWIYAKNIRALIYDDSNIIKQNSTADQPLLKDVQYTDDKNLLYNAPVYEYLFLLKS